MKKRYVLGATALVLLGLGTSACSSQNNTDSTKSTSTKQSTKKTDNEMFGFKGSTFTNSDIKMKVTKVTNFAMTDPNLEDPNQHLVVIEAEFTNNSKKAIEPDDYFTDNFEVEQTTKKSSHVLKGGISTLSGDLEILSSEVNASKDKLNPGKTAKVAFVFGLDKEDGDDENGVKFAIQPVDSTTGEEYADAYKVTASTQKYTAPDTINGGSSSDSNDDTDNSSDTNSDNSNDVDTNDNSDTDTE